MKKSWIKKTFSDNQNQPSYKRQMATILILACLYGVISKIDIDYVKVLASLVGAILLGTSAEKFSNNRDRDRDYE